MTQTSNTSDFIDIKGLIKTYLSKWYYFVISVVVMGLLGLLFIGIVKPKYQVNANIVLSTSNTSSIMTAALGSLGDLGSTFGANADVEDEIFIITSHGVLKEVAKDLNTNIIHDVKTGFLAKDFKYTDFPVQVYPAPGMLDTLRTSILFTIKADSKGEVNVKAKARGKTVAKVKDAQFPVTVETPYGNFVIDKTSHYPEGESLKTNVKVMGYGTAAELLAEKISIDMASKRSNVLMLGYVTPYPIYGEDVLNKVIEVYNQRGIKMKNMQNSRTSTFLRERLDMAEAELNEAEAELMQYQQKNGIANLESDAEYTYMLKGESEGKLTAAQTNSEILKTTLDFLSNPENAYSLIPALPEGGEALADVVTTYNNLVLRRMNMVKTVKANNPTLVKLEEQIDAMRKNIHQSLEKAYRNSLIQVRDLQKSMNQSSAVLGSMPKYANEYVSLRRSQEIKQQMYLYLLKNYEQTQLAIANDEPQAEIIDEAYTLREPLGFDKKVWLVIFVFIGLCIPPVVIYLQSVFKKESQQDAPSPSSTEA
ncbi:MAG: hypothetical protein LIP03_08765 [Bacteroidales bacterium]|nr:hypothetical protein [Bacteroidales bacterium]